VFSRTNLPADLCNPGSSLRTTGKPRTGRVRIKRNRKACVRQVDYQVLSFRNAMTREDWIEKEVTEQEKKMSLDVHNKSTLRSMKAKESDFWQKEAVRQDNHTGRDDH
jgi:hypothetical protein